MTTFIDTSSLYAILDADDAHHAAAAAAWTELVEARASLITHSYCLVETFALVQHRLGLAAVRGLQESIVPLLGVQWVEPALHEAAVAALLIAGRRDLSLVDCVSFETMRRLGTTRAFTFDQHFGQQGFEVIPAAL